MKAFPGAGGGDVELARAFPFILLPFDVAQVAVEGIGLGAGLINGGHQAFEAVLLAPFVEENEWLVFLFGAAAELGQDDGVEL